MYLRVSAIPLVLLVSVELASLCSQVASQTSSAETPTIKASARLVLVDVVVRSHKGEPMGGLPASDFKIFEDGVPQIISSLEEHKAGTIEQTKLPPMPPNVFTNFPTAKVTDALDVLLVDCLNSEPRDEASLRQNLLKYLKAVRPGTRIALFTLGSRLRMVYGFTTDLSGLAIALGDKKSGAVPQFSPFFMTAFQKDAEKSIAAVMAMNQASPEAIDALKQFQADETSRLEQSRAAITLQALQQLCRYLSRIPGRKNLIWFADSFPINYLPGPASRPSQSLNDDQETAAMLSDNQVAVYPVSTQGLLVDSQYDSGTFQPDSMQAQSRERNLNQVAMQSLADETGGEAFVNTNGFSDAINKVLRDGSQYYTLAYRPSNGSMHGEYRRIKVVVNDCHCDLEYRRGYYAQQSGVSTTGEGEKSRDPLIPLMAFGMPDFDQIIYKISVAPKDDSPAAPQQPEDSKDTKSSLRRYAVDFAIATGDLQFQTTADGVRHGSIGVAMIVYSRQGEPLKVASRRANLSISPDVFKEFQKAGLQVHGEIEIPLGESYLRTGVYDYEAGTIGTLGVPVSISAQK